jgi:hypothetical protein
MQVETKPGMYLSQRNNRLVKKRNHDDVHQLVVQVQNEESTIPSKVEDSLDDTESVTDTEIWEVQNDFVSDDSVTDNEIWAMDEDYVTDDDL